MASVNGWTLTSTTRNLSYWKTSLFRSVLFVCFFLIFCCQN
uniref:Uncharacterized protein n=1 Tax=Rhizophora mucronata TaxID=61149 RepID=A0A2P2QT86_RHIMU